MKLHIGIAMAVIGAVGGYAIPAGAAPAAKKAPVVFARDITPILTSSCATCHLMGTEAGRMSLAPRRAYAALVNVASVEAPKLKRVVPGRPEQSYLMMKLEGTHISKGGTGARMPFGAPPLAADKIDLFRRWISEGAKS